MKFQGLCLLAVVAVGVTTVMIAADPQPTPVPVKPRTARFTSPPAASAAPQAVYPVRQSAYSAYQAHPQTPPPTGLLSQETIKKLLAENPDLVPTLLTMSGDEADSDIGSQAVMAVAGLGNAAVPAVLKALQESEDEVPLMCLIHAATKPDFPIEDVVPVLLKMSKSEDADRRTLAKYGLAQILLVATNSKVRAMMSQQLAESILD